MNVSCCSAAAEGGMKKGKTIVWVLNSIDPGGCACKTNKPLQGRTSDFESDHRVLTKTHLNKNDTLFSSNKIFQCQTNRTISRHHYKKKKRQSTKYKCDLYSNLLFDPDILPTILHPFCASWSLSWDSVAFSLRCAPTSMRQVHILCTWQGKLPYVEFSCLWCMWADCRW